MAKYRITDNKTGKSVVVSGDHTPSTTEAESIFQKAGLRQEKGTVDKVTDFLFGRTKDYMKTAIGSLVLGKQNDQLDQSNKGLLDQADLFVRKAKQTFDPELQKKYFDMARDLTNRASGNVGQVSGSFKESTGLDILGGDTITNKDIVNKSFGMAGEIGSYMMPQNKLLKSGNAGTRILGGAVQGGEIGTLLGATNPEAENLGERAMGAVTQGAIGVVTGAAVQGLFEVGKSGVKKLVGDASQKLRKIIRPNPSKLNKFKKFTGMDYADEIVKRDAKNIEGMGYDKLEPYFNNKFLQATQKTDKVLEASGKSVKKEWVQQQLVDVMDNYKDRPIVSEQINKTFTTYFDALEKFGDDIPLSVANNIKRDLQELAKASYSGTSGSIPKAYSKVAYKLNKEIKKLVPEAINLDKETQLYKLVSEAVSNTGSREQNKISTTFMDKLLQSFPVGLGAGVGFGTGNLPAGVLTMLGSAAAGKGREVYRSPQVQTTLASKISQGINPKMQALVRLLEESSRKGASIFATK